MRLGQVVQSSCLTPCDVCPGAVSPAVRTCIGCELSYCKDCLERTHGNGGLGHCLVKPEENVESEMPRCRQHGQLVELFCQTDGVPVCLECLQTGRHKGHNATSMEDWANKEQMRHDARAHRKRVRQESDKTVAEDTDENINGIESVKEQHHPNKQLKDSVHPPSTREGLASVPYGNNSGEASRPARNDIGGTGVDNLSREGRPVGWNYTSSRDETSDTHPRTIREKVRPVARSIKEVTTPENAVQHHPRERQQLARGCLSTGQILRRPEGDVKDVEDRHLVRNVEESTTLETAEQYLPREYRPPTRGYLSTGQILTHPKGDVKEVEGRPSVRSVKDATTPETTEQHLPREYQPLTRGSLSTGQILTYPKGDAEEVVGRPSVDNGFNNTADRFSEPHKQRIDASSSGVSTSSDGPYYISCREEVVGPVVFDNVEPTTFGGTVVEYLDLHQQRGEKPTTRLGYKDTDQIVFDGDSYYRTHARSLLDDNINSSRNVDTGAGHSQKHPRNEEQRFTTRYQNTGQILAGKEANVSLERTPKTLQSDEHRSLSTSGNLYSSKDTNIIHREEPASFPDSSPTERHQQGYGPRSQEQARKDVQQAVQDMFTKYMVTGHGLATTGQKQPSPGHTSDTVATNSKRSTAVFRPARKLLGMPTETKATRIAQAVEIANNPQHGPQSQSTSGLGLPSEIGMKEPLARPTPKPRSTLETAHNQKYLLKVNTAEDENMQRPQYQNSGGFENVRPDTRGGRPIETEPQVVTTQPGANYATVTSPVVSSGQGNRLGDSGNHVQVDTPTTVSPASSQLSAEKSDGQSNMVKVPENPTVMGQRMKEQFFKARSSLRLSGRRGKPSSRDVPTHPKSVNMAMSLEDTASTRPKRQDHRNGGVTSTDRTDKRQAVKSNSTAAPRSPDPSLAVRIARVLPQRRNDSQLDITAQSTLPRIIPSLCGVGHTWITLRWTVSEAENYKAYQVQYQKHGGPVNVTPFRYGSTRETVDNLSPGTTYTMQVRALDMEGLVHCSNKVEMKTSSRRLAVPAQETAAKLRQAVQQAREKKGQEAKSKKPSRWGLSHLTSSFRRKKKKSATSESDTESCTDLSTAGRRESDVRRSSIDSQESEISTVSTISRTSRKSQKRVHFKEEDITKAYEIREMQALYPELSNVEQGIDDDVALPERPKLVAQREYRTHDERDGKAGSKQHQADVERRQEVSSPVFMALMDHSEESETETFKQVADNVRGTIGMSITKVSVEVQTQERGVFRPVVRTSTVRGSGEDTVPLKSSDRSASLPEWDTNVDTNIADKSTGFRNVKRERTWQEIIEEDYDPKEGWKNVQVGDKMRFIDLEAIKPYRKVLTHAGYYGDKSNAIVVFSSCYMPNSSLKDYEYIMENLFLYILSFLDKVVDDEYKIVFLNYTKDKSNLPSVTWLKSCYDHIDAKFKKKLKGLFIVHPTMWLKMLVHFSKPFVSSKFSKKLQFVDNFKDLQKQLPVDPEAIPEDVKKFEEELVGGSGNKGGTFAALRAALGREVQTGSVPENAFCAPYNKGLSSNMWEGFPTLRL
ncbi:uncharacterized protein [Branchiostoma lanceolatum]|uniref:uncharacterized protein isoform X2 n=1 Tax=Branchiostoma lanceolatum TaxID=7740 RepID=UPI003453D71F